jgi:hypothetical protein
MEFIVSCRARRWFGVGFALLLVAASSRVLAGEPSGPRSEVLALALRAHDCAVARGEVDASLLTIVDYSLPSVEPRLWSIDVASRRVLFEEQVAHGRQSGENFAVSFSNRVGSKQSSLGLFRTAEAYQGRHGYSLRLDGLEPGFNDKARERAIVFHGAWYVSPAFAAEHGRLGRSWGCPAVALGAHRRIIDTIKGGSSLFVYHPDESWLNGSMYLNGCGGES